jgi:hypothetical protein
VSGEIAGSLCPFCSGLTIGFTIGTCFVGHHSITPFAGLHGGIAPPTVIGTAILLHKDAFCSYFDGLTNHGNQPPFYDLFFHKVVEIIQVYSFMKEHKKKSYRISVTHFGSKPNGILLQ